VTKQLSIKLDDELDAQIRAAAEKDGCSISAWIAKTARQRLVREMWERYAKTAEALGLNDPEWMAKEVAAREAVQARAPR
jgi:predicted transcriptional regulator